jgi:hypothetical protein
MKARQKVFERPNAGLLLDILHFARVIKKTYSAV